MATIGGKTPSRETALALLAQVERQAGMIARRYTGNEAVLDRFTEFRTFIDALSEFQLFIDMVENRLGALAAAEQAVQAQKLVTIRATILAMELATTSEFLDRMVLHDRPWPMGSQKFLRRRLTRLDDIAAFHVRHGEACQLTPPDAAQMQNIRNRVAAQIDNSVPLADFGDAAPPPPREEPVVEAAEGPEPVAAAPVPEPPAPPPVEAPRAAEPRPAAAPPAAPPQPDVMIPGMMGFAAPPPSPSPRTADAMAKTPAPVSRPLAAAPVLPDLMIPGMIMPEPPPASEPPLADDWEPPPPPSASPPPPAASSSSVPQSFDADYVAQKAREIAQKATGKADAKTGTPGLARRDFRLQVRSEADGYQYIDGNGVAVITESCRVANTTLDELAKTLELSRPGLVLILNGRDPVSSELLKTLRRFVRRTGGLA